MSPVGAADKVIVVGPDGEEADVVAGVLQTSGGGGGGGGPATIADGADVAQGAVADVVVAAGAAGTVSAKLRRLTTDIGTVVTRLAGGLPAALGAGGGLKVDGSGTALPVSGTVTVTPSGTQASSIADGSDVTLGAIADAAVVTSASGTVSAKLRGIVSLLVSGITTVGNVASAATDSGNPVKIGGVGRTATITPVTNGQRVDLSLTPIGAMIVAGTYDGSSGADARPGIIGVTRRDSGGISEAPVGLIVAGQLLNGTTWDRARNNEAATLLASAARTALASSADQVNYNGRGIMVVVNVTAEAGTTTLTLTIQGKDPVSSNYFDLIAGVVVYNAATDTPTVTRAVLVYPGALVADAIGAGNANLISAKALAIPRTWRVTVTPSDASSQTYSVGGVTIV